jgi:hypothetical protein
MKKDMGRRFGYLRVNVDKHAGKVENLAMLKATVAKWRGLPPNKSLERSRDG